MASELKHMSQNKKIEFPRYVHWFVYDRRHKGLLDDDDDSKISIGLYCNSQVMKETYESLVSCENMTDDILIQHLVATANKLHRARNQQCAEYKGMIHYFFISLCFVCTRNNTEGRENYGLRRTSPYSTFHALYSWFYGEQDNEKKVKHFKKE